MSDAKFKHYTSQLRSALVAGQWESIAPLKSFGSVQAISWGEGLRKWKKHAPASAEDLFSEANSLIQLGKLIEKSHKSIDTRWATSQHHELLLQGECVASETNDLTESNNSDGTKALLAYAAGKPTSCLTLLNGAKVEGDDQWATVQKIRNICLQGMSHELLSQAPNKEHTPLSLPDILAIYTSAIPRLQELEVNKYAEYEELWRWVCLLLCRCIILSARCRSLHTVDETALPSLFALYTTLSASWPPTFRPSQRSVITVIQLRYITLRSRSSLPLPVPENPEQEARNLLEGYFRVLQKCTKYPKAGHRNWKAEELGEAGAALALSLSVPHASTDFGWVVDILLSIPLLVHTPRAPALLRHLSRVLYLSDSYEALNLARRTQRLYVQLVSKSIQTYLSAKAQLDNPSDLASQDVTLPESPRTFVESLVFGVWMLCLAVSHPYPHTSGTRHRTQNLPNLSGLGLGTSLETGVVDDLQEARRFLDKAREVWNDFLSDSAADRDLKELEGNLDLVEGVWERLSGRYDTSPITRPHHYDNSHVLLMRAHNTLDNLSPPSSSFPVVLYHLSIAYASPGDKQDLDLALKYAGQAVETLSEDRREQTAYNVKQWHLLGLILTMREKWDAAEQVFETALSIAATTQPLAALDEGMPGEGTSASNDTIDGLPNKQSASELSPIFLLPPTLQTLESFDSLQATVGAPFPAAPTSSTLYDALSFITAYIPKSITGASSPSPRANRDHLWYIPPAIPSTYLRVILQLRMSYIALSEKTKGGEVAAEEVRIAFEQGSSLLHYDDDPDVLSDNTRPTTPKSSNIHASSVSGTTTNESASGPQVIVRDMQSPTPGIMIEPATPDATGAIPSPFQEDFDANDSLTSATGSSAATSSDTFRGPPSHQVSKPLSNLKSRVHRSSAKLKDGVKDVRDGIRDVGGAVGGAVKKSSKGVARGVRRGSISSLRKMRSTPDLHAVLKPTTYQASSIHSRRRLGSVNLSHEAVNKHGLDDSHLQTRSEGVYGPARLGHSSLVGLGSYSPTPWQSVTKGSSWFLAAKHTQSELLSSLLCDLWVMSSAIFRRLGKIEQCRGALQEAETLASTCALSDTTSARVWVQLGLYHLALGQPQKAIEGFQKALFVDPENVDATVNLARIHLETVSNAHSVGEAVDASNDSIAAAGTDHADLLSLSLTMLVSLTKGGGWNIPEAWYFLAKAYGQIQQRKRERECLTFALRLAEQRGVRCISACGL